MEKVKLKRIIIAAVSQNRIIGNNNSIPWHSKSELLHFKTTTMGFPIIMGRMTYEAIGKKLEGRLNIIISRNDKLIQSNKNILQFNSVNQAYKFLRAHNYKKVFICGGKSIYTNCIKHAEQMIISEMKFEIDGDTKFPKINKNIWNEVKSTSKKEFIVKYYERNK